MIVIICLHAGRPPDDCFKEVSIDGSCTFLVEEGAATFCVGAQHPDTQEVAWVAVAVFAAVVLALVTIAAVWTVRRIKE